MEMARGQDRKREESPLVEMSRDNDQSMRIYVTKCSSKIIL